MIQRSVGQFLRAEAEAGAPSALTPFPGFTATFAVDAQRTIVAWDAGAEALLGIRAEEALGRHCYDVLRSRQENAHAVCNSGYSLCRTEPAGITGPACRLIVRTEGRTSRLVTTQAIGLPPSSGASGIILLRQSGLDPCPSLSAPLRPLVAENLTGEHVSSLISRVFELPSLTREVNPTNLRQVLEDSLRSLVERTGAEAAEIFLQETQNGAMVMVAHHGLFLNAFRQITRFPRGVGFPGIVAQTNLPVICSDLTADRRYLRTEVKEKGFHTYLCMPLMSASGVIGSLNVAFRSNFDDVGSQLRLLAGMSGPLAASVELNWLRQRDLIDSCVLDEQGSGIQRLEPILAHTLASTMMVAEAPEGLAIIWHPENRRLVACMGSGLGHDFCRVTRTGDPSSCPAASEGRPVLFPPDQPGVMLCHGSGPRVGTLVCMPLVVRQRVVGAIALQYHRRLTIPTAPLGLVGGVLEKTARAVDASLRSRPDAAPVISVQRSKVTPQAQVEEPLPQLDIHCFGQFRLYRNGELVPRRAFRRRKSLAVLKILLMHRGRPVPRDVLVDSLWPEAEQEDAFQSLWVVIHDLRRGLALSSGAEEWEQWIKFKGGYYYFDTQVAYRLDVEDFEKGIQRGRELEAQSKDRDALEEYERAALLYRGDFLEDELYSEWCSAEREYLRETYLALLKGIASKLASRGEVERAISYYRKALSVDSLREELHRDLMGVLWQAHRRDEAIRQYSVCYDLLQKDLGISPAAETTKIYREILESIPR